MPLTRKTAFAPWGGGARICLGINIAKIELRLASALFFRSNKGARVSPSMTAESMEFENYFLMAPVSHKCMIKLTLKNVEIVSLYVRILLLR